MEYLQKGGYVRKKLTGRKLKDWIYRKLQKSIEKEKYSQCIVLCIGTEKVVGDLYGPLVGEKLENELSKRREKRIQVVGKLGENVTYQNVKEKIRKIEKEYLHPYIIAIDSAVAEEKNIGKVVISKRKIKVGEIMEQEIYEVGDISIKAIVGKRQRTDFKNYQELKNISSFMVERLAEETAKGILKLEV